MKLPIASITVDRDAKDTRRFRKDFGDIQKLAASLKEHGQIQPIVIDRQGGKNILVAGERRMTAAAILGWTDIEVTFRDQLTNLERKLLELEENIQRKDITWGEQIEATAQLHALKVKQCGSRGQGSHTDAGWSQEDTAEFIGASKATISQDIQLAKDLSESPELKKLVQGMGKFEARKAVEREKRAKKLAKQVEKNNIDLDAQLIFGDCTELIKTIPDESVNCLITDPPWGSDGILAVARGNLSGKYEGLSKQNAMGNDEVRPLYKALLPELRRVMSPGAHFYLFLAPDWYQYFIETLTAYGFVVHPVPLIWAKQRTTMIPNPYHYVPSYEMILFGCRQPQNRTLRKPRANCILDYPAMAPQKKIHSLQKPIGLIEMMIENSTVPGETILDCFAGSGVVLQAAKRLSRKGIGFENDKGNYYAAKEWLEKGDS